MTDKEDQDVGGGNWESGGSPGTSFIEHFDSLVDIVCSFNVLFMWLGWGRKMKSDIGNRRRLIMKQMFGHVSSFLPSSIHHGS